ncbi:MAG: tripartite tricarboxylate transporter substrate binding protein [Candidatus Competibacteraceae bacterium]|nr:tripartite tricarboxylate transporter substrate binding protein [Candidatus Competibacteraceae bacterium]MCB1804518.1 tripartite tricarboxylate transporter substrate binding protein [Candidatus Competibacteraceae bacterium]MCB1812184.1 tripartite tricarboxylate transporter substrate binding protein [Candidatus Competibacteraceae bacterium]
MRRMLTMLAVVTLAFGLQNLARAEWPEKPVKIIVPFKAGGTSDQVARAFQAAIQENDILPQPTTIINVGGHYSIGARQVMEADPDGYTFLVLHVALMGGEAGGMFDFGYRDFAPVAATGQFCVLPMVRKDSGINSVDELLAKAKAEPDTLLFGANLGAINHMAGLMLQNTEPGAKFRFVQIGGGTANYTALTGAQTNVTVLSGAEVINFTRLPDGSDNPEAQIKPLAYTGAERNPRLPEMPTMKELGRDMEFCIDSWWFAPKDTPAEAIQGMVAALEKASATDRITKFYDIQAFAPTFLQGEALKKSLDDTWARVEPVAKQAKQK